MKTDWTADRVKAELPDVPVMLPGGRIVTGVVRGRLSPFATVTVGDFPAAGIAASFEFAWGSISRAMNAGRPLRA